MLNKPVGCEWTSPDLLSFNLWKTTTVRRSVNWRRVAGYLIQQAFSEASHSRVKFIEGEQIDNMVARGLTGMLRWCTTPRRKGDRSTN